MRTKAFDLKLVLPLALLAVILLLIALPSYRALRDEANRTRAEGELRVLAVALDAYRRRHGQFPPSDNYQQLLLSETAGLLDRELTDPFSSGHAAYLFGLSPNGAYYVIYSLGPGQNGRAEINDLGTLSIRSGNPIYVTNSR